MAFYNIVRIAGLSSMLITIRKLCVFVGRYGASVRAFVPEESLTVYDNGLTAILAVCAILEAVAAASITPA